MTRLIGSRPAGASRRDAIQAVADEARSTASGLRRMAGNYDDNETTSGRRYTKAQTRLSRTPS